MAETKRPELAPVERLREAAGIVESGGPRLCGDPPVRGGLVRAGR